MKDLQLPPRPTFTGQKSELLIKHIKDLEIQFEANKNCLNCHNYYLNNGNELNCKLGKKFHTICKEWIQK